MVANDDDCQDDYLGLYFGDVRLQPQQTAHRITHQHEGFVRQHLFQRSEIVISRVRNIWPRRAPEA